MKQVATMTHYATKYKVMYDENDKYNPYKVYKTYYSLDGKKHTRQLKNEQYADFASALYMLADMVKAWEYGNKVATI